MTKYARNSFVASTILLYLKHQMSKKKKKINRSLKPNNIVKLIMLFL